MNCDFCQKTWKTWSLGEKVQFWSAHIVLVCFFLTMAAGAVQYTKEQSVLGQAKAYDAEILKQMAERISTVKKQSEQELKKQKENILKLENKFYSHYHEGLKRQMMFDQVN